MGEMQDWLFWLSVAAMSGALVWGLKLIATTLNHPVSADEDKSKKGQTVFSMSLREKAAAADETSLPDPSVSRVAVAIGALALAAFFVGLAYFSLYALFYEPGLLDGLEKLKIMLLAGAALFLPYAFNSIASIFKA